MEKHEFKKNNLILEIQSCFGKYNTVYSCRMVIIKLSGNGNHSIDPVLWLPFGNYKQFKIFFCIFDASLLVSNLRTLIFIGH